MLQEYLYEIIILITILTSVVIYFLTKKFKQEEDDILDDINSRDKNKIQAIEETSLNEVLPQELEEEIVEPEDSTPYVLSGEEEGSFGNISNNPFEENTQIIQKETIKNDIPVKAPRKKVEVPAHGKISKENFKEFAGVKILVAEDNLINQKVIRGLLGDTGIEVTMADDGQETLDILENNSDFNIILMDAHMPRVDGFEATRIIRANPEYEHIVVVALSGDTASDDIRKMIDAGMEEQLEKPLRMDSLYDVLYAYTKDDSKDKEFVEVVMTKELNGDKGLAICGGDDEFYKEILKEFSQNYVNASKELYDLLEKEDIRNADAMLLDFIGITANIGADNIRVIALELKEAIKDIRERSYVTLVDEFESHLKVLLRDIKEYTS